MTVSSDRGGAASAALPSSFSGGLATPRASPLDWAPALLLICVVGFLVAFLAVRAFLPSAPIVLIAGLALALRLRRDAVWDRANAAAIGLMMAIIAWTLLQALWTPLGHLATGRAALFAACTAIAAAVSGGRTGPDALIPALGAGTLLALGVSEFGVHTFGYDGFGLGNPNHLLNACSPADAAWLAYLAARAAQRRAVAWWQYPAAALLTAMLWYEVFYAFPGFPRRGVIAAAGGAAAAAALAAIWQWRRWAAVVAAVLGLALVAVAAAWYISHRPEDSRSERLTIYAAAAQAAGEWLPWGGGSYASFRFESAHGEAVRHMVATNIWAVHVHCELLEQAVCGGIPAVALMLAWTVVLVRRTLLIEDPALRYASICGGAALLVHANTDNAYGIPACIGWAGVLLGAFMRPPIPSTAAPVAWPRVAAIAIGAAAALAAIRELPATVLPRLADPTQRVSAIRASAMADFHVSQWAAGVDDFLAAGRFDEAADLVALLRRRIDGASNTGFARCLVWARIGERERSKYETALHELTSRPLGAIPEVARAAAFAARADLEELDAAVRYVHRSPFNRLGYDHLDQVLTRRPDLVPLAPPTDIVRLRYRRGDRGLPPPHLGDPRTIDDAADLFAAIMWAHQRGWGAERTGPALRQLLGRYGDVPDVCLLTVEMLRDLPDGSFPWLESRRDAIVHASEKIYPVDRMSLLDSITTPEQARRVWPILHWIYPATVESVEQRRMNTLRDNYDPLWQDLVRIWGLTRHVQAQDAP